MPHEPLFILCRDEITRDLNFSYSDANIAFSVVLTFSKVALAPITFHSLETPNQSAGIFSEDSVL